MGDWGLEQYIQLWRLEVSFCLYGYGHSLLSTQPRFQPAGLHFGPGHRHNCCRLSSPSSGLTSHQWCSSFPNSRFEYILFVSFVENRFGLSAQTSVVFFSWRKRRYYLLPSVRYNAGIVFWCSLVTMLLFIWCAIIRMCSQLQCITRSPYYRAISTDSTRRNESKPIATKRSFKKYFLAERCSYIAKFHCCHKSQEKIICRPWVYCDKIAEVMFTWFSWSKSLSRPTRDFVR